MHKAVQLFRFRAFVPKPLISSAAMLVVSNLAKFYGEQLLFEGVSVQFNDGQRYGIVGANGSGKSTFLRILAGQEIPSDGTWSMPKRARVGVLEQDHFQYEHNRIVDVVMMGNAELWAAMEEKDALLENSAVEFDADRYAELEDIVVRHDGYTLEARAAEVLEGLGIPAERHTEPLSVLSGGFKLRVLLAKTLASTPEILMLDEPTNHLDILSIRWLEKFLENYPGCSLVISHDHRFLDNVCTSILDVDYGTAVLYKGNYSAFKRAKVEDRERREAEITKQEKKIEEHKAFVDRFRAKASKARQAQSKVKQIEKIEIEELAPSSRRYPKFNFLQRRPSGKVVVEGEGISKSYDNNQVLESVDLEFRRGERIAVIGPNGIGKSTLLKILVGAAEADEGEVEWGYETHVGYFAQDHKEQLAESRNSKAVGPTSPGALKRTVEEWLWDYCAAEPIGFVRGKLGAVLFSGDDVKKKIGSLSGGEAARLIFAKQIVEKPNVLVLDEPTNHLDIEAIEALVHGLKRFEGTLIFVSHDRWFVGELATRILEIRKDSINDFHGSYDEYIDKLGDDHLDSDAVLRKARAKKRKDRKERERPESDHKEKAKQRTKLDKELEHVADQMESAEARMGEINEKFCDPSFFDAANQKQARKVEAEQKDLRSKLAELEERFEDIGAELEELG